VTEGPFSSLQNELIRAEQQMEKNKQTNKQKKPKNKKTPHMLRVIEHRKAADEESSTKCMRGGPAWQTGSFAALSCVAVGPNAWFALLQLGRAPRCSGPAPLPYSHGSVLSPQCFHWFGLGPYLLL